MCLNIPAAFVGVEFSVSNHTVERSVALDIEDFVAVIEVGPKLLVVWIVVRPIVSREVSSCMCKWLFPDE